jgi:hypothetical protein
MYILKATITVYDEELFFKCYNKMLGLEKENICGTLTRRSRTEGEEESICGTE